MPGEGPTGGCFLEGDGGGRHFAAEQVAPRAGFKMYDALLKMGILVISRPYSYASSHEFAPLWVAAVC
jgi:hypothetical protein